jgi:hypothetical protein
MTEERLTNKKKCRQPARLATDFEKAISAYVFTAISAGVSVLAMNMTSEAEVVYTPANTPIPVNNNGFVPLDLNHDGIVDFAFWNFRSTFGTGDRSSHTDRFNLYVGCAPSGISCRYRGNEVWGTRQADARRLATPLSTGFLVGSDKSHFQQFPEGQGYVLSPVALMGKMRWFYNYEGSFSGSSHSGSWQESTNRFVGLQFLIDGKVHYGWARLSVNIGHPQKLTATLTGYAYETIPGKAIVIKPPSVEPPSLGQLARGADAIASWRSSRPNPESGEVPPQ